jgi:ABC-2 type transport system permease protein
MSALRDHLRTLKSAAWLGWQLESNWTEPSLFLVYMLVKPVAGSLLLVCMYFAARAASGGAVPEAFLPYVYVSNACYALVGGVTYGLSYVVFADREHYGMLKYVYVSPARLPSYFIGRGLARSGQAVVGAALNLAIGAALFPGLRQALAAHPVAWGWLAFDLLVGTVMLLALGMILVGVALNMGRHGAFLSEGLAGAMYLVCGVVFPLGVLPPALQAVGLALPPTYWLEGVRRALLGPSELPSPLSSWDQGALALALAASTALLTVAAVVVFRWGERRAWRLGRIEESSGA